jgi:hypothetical protein
MVLGCEKQIPKPVVIIPILWWINSLTEKMSKLA